MGILGGSVPSGSPNLDPISAPKMSFFTPTWSSGRFSLFHTRFQTWFLRNYVYHYLDQNANKIHFEFAYFSVFIQLELKLMFQPVISSKPLPHSRPKWPQSPGNAYTRFQTKTALKPYPLGWHIPTWLI